VGEQQRKLLAYRKGESDLVYRNGKLYLYATCEIPEASVVAPNGFLGVDLGIVNVATTSDGTRYGGKHLNRIRRRNQRLRAKLQRKGHQVSQAVAQAAVLNRPGSGRDSGGWFYAARLSSR
jgi:putative transposase